MKVIGITGGIGSGKSTVLDELSSYKGVKIIKADDVAKLCMKKGQLGFTKTVELFGEDIIGEDGELNKARISSIIFNNANKRIVLNSIIHPLVKNKIIEEITKYRIAGDIKYVFVEAALLIEDHYDHFCDELWYIYVPENVRRVRLKESRGYEDEKIDSIFKSQLNEEAFRAACSVVINNGNSFEDTKVQLEKLLNL